MHHQSRARKPGSGKPGSGKPVSGSSTQLSDDRSQALVDLRNRYVNANAHPLTLNLLTLPERAAIACASKPHSAIMAQEQRNEPIVCRYHPALRRILNRTIAQVPPPNELGINLRPAWKNSLPSMASNVIRAGHCREGRREGFLCVSETRFPQKPLHTYMLSTSLACNNE